MKMEGPVGFFLGANTPDGFTGVCNELYDPLDGWRVYIIKSGPGTGKSTLLRRLLARLRTERATFEVIYCSSDPSSLDAVLLPKDKILMIDGTAPHIIEPQYWGVAETIVPLEICADTDILRENAAVVIAATQACGDAHAKVRRYIGAAAAMLSDARRIVLPHLRQEKIDAFIHRFMRNFKSVEPARRACVTHRFLSAVTPQGYTTLTGTLSAVCESVTVLEDPVGAAATAIMEPLCAQLAAAGHRLIVCPDPLFPGQTESIIMPDLRVGITCARLTAPIADAARVRAARFTDTQALETRKHILRFHQRAARELLAEAVAAAAYAKDIHDTMERYHISAMDWAAAEAMGDRVIDEIITHLRATS